MSNQCRKRGHVHCIENSKMMCFEFLKTRHARQRAKDRYNGGPLKYVKGVRNP